MSRKHLQKQRVIENAQKLTREIVQRPEFIASFLHEILKPEPAYIPQFAWKRMVRFILK